MAAGEVRSLTPTDVAHHLACRHRTQLERQRRAGQLNVPFAPDARLQAMRIRGEQHERDYVERLRQQGLEVVDLTGRDAAAALTAMRRGAEVLVQATLQSDTFTGIADILLRVPTPSNLGDHSYEPLDTKLAAETKASAILQLLTYCELLRSMQGTIPEHFHVVTPLTHETYRTADYAAYFRVVCAHLQSDRTAEPPPPTYPDPVPFCEVCSYWQHCDQQRRRDDHPSLIANIQTAQVRELQRQGLPTLTAVAHSTGLPADPQRGRAETYVRIADQAALQLQARTTDQPPVKTLPPEPGRGLHRLPEPSPGDVFLDFEGDPFVSPGGLEYLTGYAFHTPDGHLEYRDLWALDTAAERNATETFLDFVAARLQQHPELHVFHYGAYEVAALRRLCSRHDTRGAVLDELLRGGRFVDLHAVVREGLRIGVENYGLKQLEGLTGFTRSLDLREAGLARRDVELHLEFGRRAQITGELRAKIGEYNRDDCLAAARLRDWLEGKRAELIAGGQPIPRPVLGDTAASEQVSDKEARIAALRAELERDLPPTGQRDTEQQARALLAGLAGYFKRERKSAYWEHFRLHELPREEQTGERQMLAELEFDGVRPREKGDRTVRCAYRFPPQDTALDVGETVYLTRLEDPALEGIGTALGTVASIDHDTGIVVFKQSQAATDRRPSAVFREQVVINRQLEDAMLAFGEHVRDHGFAEPGQFTAACDLLLRRLPRRRAGVTGALGREGEDSLDAALRVCRDLDHGVLPIQGPPGSGKSFTGGRTIAALVADGKRVGVTAVSHKVIENLLKKVQETAAAMGVKVRLVKKVRQDEGEPPPGIEYIKDNEKALAAIGRGTVVAGTAWLWAREDAASKLDYLFVDEAGQMSLAMVLAFARAARNLVLLGDPQQLEQPQKGAHPDGVEIAALTHVIGAEHATIAPDQGLFLQQTWRLPPSLCGFTSELFYEERLEPRPGCERQRLDGAGALDGSGFHLVETSHDGCQASSPEEVEVVTQLVTALLHRRPTWTNRDGDTRPLLANDVLVIAPYNAQVSALRRALQSLGVRVGTVDKFQGQEAPVVVYSCTSSSPQDAPRGMNFLYDPHRLNVATSRAQCAFVMVANTPLLTPEVRTPEQMRQANGFCRFREVAKAMRMPIAMP